MELSALKYPSGGVIGVGTDLKMLLVCLKSRERNPELYRPLNKNILPRRDKAGPLVFRKGGLCFYEEALANGRRSAFLYGTSGMEDSLWKNKIMRKTDATRVRGSDVKYVKNSSFSSWF